jgi:hypothetical protein
MIIGSTPGIFSPHALQTTPAGGTPGKAAAHLPRIFAALSTEVDGFGSVPPQGEYPVGADTSPFAHEGFSPGQTATR